MLFPTLGEEKTAVVPELSMRTVSPDSIPTNELELVLMAAAVLAL